MSEARIIADIEKHGTERIRVQVDTWNGNQYVDARIYYRKEESDGEAWHPTKKGLRINYELLIELMAALESAQRAIEGR